MLILRRSAFGRQSCEGNDPGERCLQLRQITATLRIRPRRRCG